MIQSKHDNAWQWFCFGEVMFVFWLDDFISLCFKIDYCHVKSFDTVMWWTLSLACECLHYCHVSFCFMVMLSWLWFALLAHLHSVRCKALLYPVYILTQWMWSWQFVHAAYVWDSVCSWLYARCPWGVRVSVDIDIHLHVLGTSCMISTSLALTDTQQDLHGDRHSTVSHGIYL